MAKGKKSALVESTAEVSKPKVYFDPDVPQPTVEDVRCRLRCNYVVTVPQVRALLDAFDSVRYDYRALLIRLEQKARKAEARQAAKEAKG